MITLFDQEYALNAYIGEKEDLAEKRGIALGEKRGTVNTYQRLKVPFDKAVADVASQFKLSPAEAMAKVKEFWHM